jgi:hypothetical protein
MGRRIARSTVLALFTLAACGGSGGGGGGNGGGHGSNTGPLVTDMAHATCAASDFTAQVVAICKAEFPGAPAARAVGASCAANTGCDSGFCLKPFGGASYCSLRCPNGTECPQGFHCQDAGGFAACYQDVCAYLGSDSANCVTNLNDTLGMTCSFYGCHDQLNAWLNCIQGAGRLCDKTGASAACGIEQGLLDTCCDKCIQSRY